MREDTIYGIKQPRDHIDALYRICNLAKVGAAATDTANQIEHLDEAQCSVFEIIYELALQGVHDAELERKSHAKNGDQSFQ